MKGWAFLESNGVISYRSEEFLSGCPGFFDHNRDSILWVHRFDTEDIPSMLQMFQSMKVFAPKNPEILTFCRQIGFDFQKVVDYANQIRSDQDSSGVST